jgi:hypothetical protein
LPSGTRISAGDARTGNLLIRRSIFVEGDDWFDPAFGRTGGEDSDFFYRQFRRGRVFVWCDEAVVYEMVPPNRWSVAYHVKRYLRSGTLDGERIRARGLASKGLIARSALVLCVCSAVAPFLGLLRKQAATRILQKVAYCVGIITAYHGVSLLRDRD